MFDKAKARVEKFEETHEEARVVIEHVKKYQLVYVSIGVATITCLIMRGVASQSASRDVIVTAGRDAIVARKGIAMDNVSFISSNRQGPPSWVVRCLETGDVFTSQNSAAAELGITATNISRQINGLQENAQGFHFERLCIAG